MQVEEVAFANMSVAIVSERFTRPSTYIRCSPVLKTRRRELHQSSLHRDYSGGVSVVVSGIRRMNEFNPHQARLVLGWVTVFVWIYHLGRLSRLMSAFERTLN